MIQVAAYCRVSTEKDDQSNSFEVQQRFFKEHIEHHPDWTLYDIYADEGISGTSTKKRAEFNRMINDAYEGKFQLILTKEVSRFSRNILDTISYTRELRSIGVGVLFVTDRIYTLEPEAEMLLSFLASLAQEESRRTSSRVVWGQTRQMENGVVFGPSLLGYDVTGGKIAVNADGAEIVQLIFQKYAVEQVSTSEIAKFLTKGGYRTLRGQTTWRSSSVIKILRNEKYVGDLVQKKSYTPDFLTHARRQNNGAVPLIHIENHHEPIISRELWHLAQERLRLNQKRRKEEHPHTNRYVFSGKIKCAECGTSFVGRTKTLKDGTKIRRWSCGKVVREGRSSCDIGKLVRDDDAVQMLKTAVKSLPVDYQMVIDHVTTLAMDAIHAGATDMRGHSERLQLEIECVQRKKENMMDSYFSGELPKQDMQAMMQRYEKQIDHLKERLDRYLQKHIDNEEHRPARENISEVLTAILRGDTESEAFLKNILHSLTVFKDRHMELRLNHLSMVFHFTESVIPKLGIEDRLSD